MPALTRAEPATEGAGRKEGDLAAVPPTGPGRLRLPSFGLALAGVGVMLVLLSMTAFAFAPKGTPNSTWWPAAGLGVAAACTTQGRRRLATLVVIAAAGLLANLLGGRPLANAVVFALANVGEAALVAAVLAPRSRPDLRTLPQLARVFSAVLLGAAAAGTTAGLGLAAVAGAAPLHVGSSVMTAHAGAAVLGAVLICRDDRVPGRHRAEAFLLGLLVALVTYGVFRPGQLLPLAFLPLAPLVWTALRSSVRTCAIHLILTGALVTGLTAGGDGPFAAGGTLSPGVSGALLQVFLLVCAIVTLSLVVTSAQRRSALRDVRTSEQRLARQRAFDQAVLETVPAGVLACDEHGTVVLRNAVQRRMTGVPSAGDVSGPASRHGLARRLADGSTSALERSPLLQALSGTPVDDLLLRATLAVGVSRDLKVTTRQIRDDDGTLLGAVAATSDVTDELAVQDQLRAGVDALIEREEELRRNVADLDAVAAATAAVLAGRDARAAVCAAARKICDALVVILFEPDLDCDVLRATHVDGLALPPIGVPVTSGSRTAQAYTSCETQLVPDVRSDGLVAQGIVALLDAASGGPHLQATMHLPVHSDGRVSAVLVVGLRHTLVIDSSRLRGMLELLAANAALAMAREEVVRQLEAQALTDPLTGLANRRRWDEQIVLARSHAERYGDRFTLCVLDLDHFKAYNDRHGHSEGDRMLQLVSNAWMAALREGDVLARLGGEEFAVLFQRCSLADAERLANRLLCLVPLGQTASAGLAEHRAGEGPGSHFTRADQALYRAKALGRARLCLDAAATGGS